MKLVILALIMFLCSCGSTSIFPISRVAPSAELSAKKSRDAHQNYVLELTVKNLVTPDRLVPPGNNYSIWVVTNEMGVFNAGQLRTKKMKRVKFLTIIPYDFNELFITVENAGNVTYPSGIEIARTRI
jgi:hypothetical protein